MKHDAAHKHSYRSPNLRLIASFFLGLMLSALAASCNDLNVFGFQQSTESFAGISHVQLDDTGRYVLTWKASESNRKAVYTIASRRFTEVPAAFANVSFQDEGGVASGFATLEVEDDPLEWSEVAKVVGTGTYINEDVATLDTYYAFRITSGNAKAAKKKIALISTTLSPPTAWSLSKVEEKALSLAWTAMPGATGYAVTRAGTPEEIVKSNEITIGSYTGEFELDLCVYALRGALRSRTCTPTFIPASISPVLSEDVTSLLPSGSYKTADVVTIKVKYSGPVAVSPDAGLGLRLKLGNHEALALYSSGSGTSTLTFVYTLQAGDDTTLIESLSLYAEHPGGALKDEQGRALSLALPALDSNKTLAASKILGVDTVNPLPPSLVAFASATSASLTFDVDWTAGTDTNALTYRSKLCSDSSCSSNCGSPEPSTALLHQTHTGTNGASYYACVQAQDAAGNVSTWINSADPITVETSPPVATQVSSPSVDGYYKAGSTLPITVTFSAPVFVTNGTDLSLAINAGTVPRTASYVTGTGTPVLTFSYSVQPGDESEDLDTAPAGISLGATGSLKSAFGVSISLTLPAPASAGTLAQQKALVIDTTSPVAPSSVGFAGAYSTALTFNLAWNDSTDLHLATHDTKLCEAADCESLCISAGPSPLSPRAVTGAHGKTYYGCVQGRDEAGNTSAWVPSLLTTTVDTSVPTIIDITSSALDAAYAPSAIIPIQITFSEAVFVVSDSLFRLTLETGGIDTQAVFSSGSGTNVLTFSYTVSAGDVASDLDTIPSGALSLGGGTIRDAGGNNAMLTLPTGIHSLAGQKNIVIDTTAPTPPSGLSFSASYSLTPSFLMSYSPGSDSNLLNHDVKLCTNSLCNLGCTGTSLTTVSPVSVTGVVGGTYYGCAQAHDIAGNVSGYSASAATITVEEPPAFAGVVSGEVLGSWPNGMAKVELTFGDIPAPTLQRYQIYFSETASYGSFTLASPIAIVPVNDPLYDSDPGDSKILVAIPASALKDGYYFVRYNDSSGKYIDPNQSISSLVNVLKDTPGYVLVPKKFSGLAYDYYVMRYEASLSTSGSNPGGDAVAITGAGVAACSYKFHVDGTAADSSCGTHAVTKAAQSVGGVTPQASVSWSTAFFSCRNASTGSAKVRLPSEEEWRRASQWVGTSYADMWATYSTNTGGNCNGTTGAVATTSSSSLCKSGLGVQDMAGNLREWVDKRVFPYSISGNGESRYSFGPTIGQTLPNGIDNIVQRFHTLVPGASGLALTMGADFKAITPYPDRKQFGADVQTWTVPTTTSNDEIGFRCIGFRADALPTMAQLALPDDPKFNATDLLTPGLVPENFYVKDNRWETLVVTVDGTTTDAVAEGKVDLTWQPWTKTTCDSTGTCAASDAGLVYKVYRFLEPNRRSYRTATTWALAASGTGTYNSDKPIHPLAYDAAGNRLFDSTTADGTLLATITGCAGGSTALCKYTDLSTANGGTLQVGKIYDYVLVVEDALGNAIVPVVQKFRSPYFAGNAPITGASAFRLEPRYRRASVFLVDESYQLAQTQPQVMVHVPMNQSGLDHDFFIQKYEAAKFGGTVSNNSPTNSFLWPNQNSGGSWSSSAAICNDIFFRTGVLSTVYCGNGTAINPTTSATQSKPGLSPFALLDGGAMWTACRNTKIADSDGKSYAIQLASDPEWMKAADWADMDQDGIIDGSLNLFTGSIAIEPLRNGTGDLTTTRCHSDSTPASALITGSTGAGSTATCRSRYGAADMAGNVWELTDGHLYNGIGTDNGMDGLWYQQSFVITACSTFATLNNTYDLLRGLNRPAGSGSAVNTGGEAYCSSNSGARSSARGGAWYDNNEVGRWKFHVSDTLNNTLAQYGFRCTF